MKPEMSKWFETAKREGRNDDESGASYVRVVEGAPAWIIDAVRKAHQGMFPSDWIFAECEAAAEAIDRFEEEAGADEDWTMGYWITDHAEERVEVYTKPLFQWATDFCLTEIFGDAEERSAELHDAKDASVAKRLSAIQFCAIDGIVRTMLEAFNEHRDDEDGAASGAEESAQKGG